MDGDGAESDHPLKPITEVCIERAVLLKKRERVPTLLRHAPSVFSHKVHRQINSCLTGALKVKPDCVLSLEVFTEVGRIPVVLILNALETAFDDSSFVEYDITGHKSISF